MTRMHNPPHPGEVLKEYLGEISVTEAAVKFGVNRVNLSWVVTCASGVSADMAYRLWHQPRSVGGLAIAVRPVPSGRGQAAED